MDKRVDVMDVVIFLLLMSICLGLVYLVHKYNGKEQFYLLGIIYSIISFILSFKLINILGVDINANIVFNSGLLIILYYFVNRYNDKESRKFIFTIIAVTFICALFLMGSAFAIPSIYDKMSSFYQNLIFDNLAIVILYPISLVITLFLSEYCFKELKVENNKKLLKTLLTVVGIMFIDAAIFIYFSYAFIIRFDIAMKIAIDNYLIKVVVLALYILIVNRVFMVKKVK